MGEAGKEHQAFLLHCIVEMAGNAEPLQNLCYRCTVWNSDACMHTFVLLMGFVNMQAWCDRKGLDIVIHPIPKCLIFLEDLLSDVVAKKSKDPFGTIRVARKALSKIR